MSQKVRSERHKEHKSHNIQPQHEDGGTRVSGSFSNLSVSSGGVQRHVGLRRRSTVAVGRNEHVSVPRSTAKHGRDGTRRGSRRRSLVLHTRCRRTPVVRVAGDVVSSHLTTTTEQRHTANGSKLCRTSLRARFVSTP